MKKIFVLLLALLLALPSWAQEKNQNVNTEEIKEQIEEALETLQEALNNIDSEALAEEISKIVESAINISKEIEGSFKDLKTEEEIEKEVSESIRETEGIIKKEAEEKELDSWEEDLERALEEMEEALEDLEESLEDIDIDIGLNGIHVCTPGCEHHDGDDEHGHVKKEKQLKNVKTRWGMLDLGFSSYVLGDNYENEAGIEYFDQDVWRSKNVNLHIVKQRLNLVKHHVNLIYGLSLENHQYAFSNPMFIQEKQPDVTFNYDADVDFIKNKLKVTYGVIPMMFNFETNPRKKGKSFRINAGAYGGMRLWSNTKLKTSNKDKTKVKDDFNLNKFRYGLTGGFGYGAFNFYATYALNDLFDESQDSGYKVTPFSVGISVVPF